MLSLIQISWTLRSAIPLKQLCCLCQKPSGLQELQLSPHILSRWTYELRMTHRVTASCCSAVYVIGIPGKVLHWASLPSCVLARLNVLTQTPTHREDSRLGAEVVVHLHGFSHHCYADDSQLFLYSCQITPLSHCKSLLVSQTYRHGMNNTN